jgi:hypothetical protein
MEEMRKISDRSADLSTKVQNNYLPHVSQGFKSDRDSNNLSPKYKLIQVFKQLTSKYKVGCQNVGISEVKKKKKTFLLNKPLGYM